MAVCERKFFLSFLFQVQLLDVDQGNRFWVTADCLYKLSKELLFVQYHARPAALANVHMSSKAVNAKSLLEARARDSRALRVITTLKLDLFYFRMCLYVVRAIPRPCRLT